MVKVRRNILRGKLDIGFSGRLGCGEDFPNINKISLSCHAAAFFATFRNKLFISFIFPAFFESF